MPKTQVFVGWPCKINSKFSVDFWLRLTLEYTVGRPERISGPQEDCHPAESPEIYELLEIAVDANTSQEGRAQYQILDEASPLHKPVTDWVFGEGCVTVLEHMPTTEEEMARLHQ